MNCRPGDLAIMVRSDFPENLGKFVEVIELSRMIPGDVEWAVKALQTMETDSGVDPAGSVGLAFDSGLRPIRYTDGVDETIEYSGYPGVVL